MLYGFGMYSGWWILGMGRMVLFLIVTILLVIWGIRRLYLRQMTLGHDQALEVLQQRYAKGELNVAEYGQARARLEEIPAA
jgi:putative membrane protein